VPAADLADKPSRTGRAHLSRSSRPHPSQGSQRVCPHCRWRQALSRCRLAAMRCQRWQPRHCLGRPSRWVPSGVVTSLCRRNCCARTGVRENMCSHDDRRARRVVDRQPAPGSRPLELVVGPDRLRAHVAK
jgi:hypothetical protein